MSPYSCRECVRFLHVETTVSPGVLFYSHVPLVYPNQVLMGVSKPMYASRRGCL